MRVPSREITSPVVNVVSVVVVAVMRRAYLRTSFTATSSTRSSITGMSAHRGSPLALTVLALLHYRPLHPYGVQRLIQQWGKDQVVNVGQRASLYRTIDRLLAD